MTACYQTVQISLMSRMQVMPMAGEAECANEGEYYAELLYDDVHEKFKIRDI